jgi:hypothetical protein
MCKEIFRSLKQNTLKWVYSDDADFPILYIQYVDYLSNDTTTLEMFVVIV